MVKCGWRVVADDARRYDGWIDRWMMPVIYDTIHQLMEQVNCTVADQNEQDDQDGAENRNQWNAVYLSHDLIRDKLCYVWGRAWIGYRVAEEGRREGKGLRGGGGLERRDAQMQ